MTRHRMLTVAEVAEILRVSKPTAYRVSRKIGVRAGKRIVVTQAALDAWIARGGDRDDAARARGDIAVRLDELVRP